MADGPKWLGLPACNWLHGFYGNPDLLTGTIKKHAASSKPCFLSYEANHNDVVAAYVNATGSRPDVVTLLRSPLSWVLSAAEHWQRPSHGRCGKSAATCNRNDGLEDLVSAGCFWPPGNGAPPESYHSSKCSQNYRFTDFVFQRLLTNGLPMRTPADVEGVVAKARKVLRTSHVGLVER